MTDLSKWAAEQTARYAVDNYIDKDEARRVDASDLVTNHDTVMAFGRALIDAGALRTADEAWSYYAKPWQWGRLYVEWALAGSPQKGRIGWTDFWNRDDVEGLI